MLLPLLGNGILVLHPGPDHTEGASNEFLGIASGNADHSLMYDGGRKDLYHNTTADQSAGEYSTDYLPDAAIAFIEEKTGRETAWMGFILPFDAPHHPGDRNVASR